MNRIASIALLAGMLSATACQQFSEFANEMAPNSAINSARAAMGAGDLGGALNLWQTVLTTAAGDEDLKSEALFNLALIRLSTDSEYRDLNAARGHLSELQSMGSDYRAPETAALLNIVNEMGGLVAQLDAKEQELMLKDEKIREIAETALGASAAGQP
jgi:hypothetical protein